MTYFMVDSFSCTGLMEGAKTMSPPPSVFSGKTRFRKEVRYIVREAR